ncbi:MAG: M28 family peptidase [Planctomycetota bacterium]
MTQRLGIITVLIAAFGIAACAGTGGGDAPPADADGAAAEVPAPAETTPRPAAGPPTGFATAETENRLAAESALAGSVRAASLADHLRQLAREPHPPGSARNAGLGRWVAETLESWGYVVETARYEVLAPTPVSISLELTSPHAFQALLREPPLEGDFDTTHAEILPPFNAFSASGDVEAQLVYANYGRREDFEALEAQGVTVAGRIVIARLGESYRGSKARLAEQRGAAGLLLYSDPADDGFARGEVLPRGRFRPETGAARGTVLYGFLRPGDPGTPGRPSVPGAEQATFGEMDTLPRIPVVTLSFADARPFLEGLGGDVVPEGWRGAGPFTYHLGGDGRAIAHLVVEMDDRLRPISNVVATLPGGELADEEILVTCHRDAWTHGAVDPGSGHAVLLEVARVFAEAARSGAPPRRTVRFVSFDGEELGLVGSTEWMEEHADELSARTVLVIDLDAAVSGDRFELDGVPGWRPFAESVLALAPRGESPGALAFGPPRHDADHAPFLGHLGISTMQIGSRGRQGLTHSRYDTFSALRRAIDPDFSRHARVARFAARFLHRAANARLLPVDFAAYARNIAAQIAALESARPELDLSGLRELVDRAALAGDRIEAARTVLLERKLDAELALALDRQMIGVERALLLEGGLPGRPFYRHALYAPHPDLGYEGVPLPSLSEALERGREGAQREGARLAGVFAEFARRVETLATRMEGIVAR